MPPNRAIVLCDFTDKKSRLKIEQRLKRAFLRQIKITHQLKGSKPEPSNVMDQTKIKCNDQEEDKNLIKRSPSKIPYIETNSLEAISDIDQTKIGPSYDNDPGEGSSSAVDKNCMLTSAAPSIKGKPSRWIRSEADYVALDCEFVGVPPNDTSALGRCSIVGWSGEVLLDIYAKPDLPITHYRTRWSGIRRSDMRNAVPIEHALNAIKKIIQGKIVVGHALSNDFRVLKIQHPLCDTRDTDKYIPLKKMAGMSPRGQAGLKKLAKALLDRDIQVGKKGHSSIEDSQATMEIYKLVHSQWEYDVSIGEYPRGLTNNESKKKNKSVELAGIEQDTSNNKRKQTISDSETENNKKAKPNPGPASHSKAKTVDSYGYGYGYGFGTVQSTYLSDHFWPQF
ncbi:unnamed protein product [Owenia fusiformis]|uniref:Uncharacterized protein n=1 Tax=Owenia fusiformis TaxID=6347 RepID=A0A8J1TU87_OWEFU|nr:unnamed protein product [Owenia fusiformis]